MKREQVQSPFHGVAMNNTHLVVLESRDYVPPFHGVAMNNTHLVVLEGRDYEPPISRRCNE